MQIGMIGLGRMGANLTRRLLRAGHEVVVYARTARSVAQLAGEGAVGAASLADLVARLVPPRTVWLMVPADAVDAMVEALLPLLSSGDTLVDGGNSFFRDSIRRAAAVAARNIDFLDVGTSGGVWGLERGYCLMIGGPPAPVARLDPVFRALAPGTAAAPRLPARTGTPVPAESGYLHCGPSGAGHFVKMVHNGIEYGIMAAYAEGFGILRRAAAGARADGAEPGYDFDLDLGAIAELWRRGSVIGSWLLDLGADALARDPGLDGFAGRVADSGEGRWCVRTAVDEGVPAPVLAAALFGRFASRGHAEFGDKFLSALRNAFGGHVEPGPSLQASEPPAGSSG